ncbi:MAG: acyl-CoA thioesterase [Clostridia bacterium]|nr:acyl-CoA thioesterase [Clostridia bacterium]
MENRTDYVHIVHYYETDKMGITHHSNYIRWMEEARVDYLSKAGWDYAKLESLGIISAVVNVSCDYKRPTKFAEPITIRASIAEFNGVTLKFAYRMTNPDGVEVCSGTSLHAFLNETGRPVSIKRKFPELYEAFRVLVAEEEA